MERTTQIHSHFERVSWLGCGGLVVVVVAGGEKGEVWAVWLLLSG